MAKKQTTNEQWELILEHMNNNPNVARGVPVFGSNKKDVDDSWELLTQKVNAIGPPQRENKEWKKVWCDLRTRLKKKISENKIRATGTGGGINTQIPLTSVEQAADSILNMTTAVNPPGVVYGLECQDNSVIEIFSEVEREKQPQVSQNKIKEAEKRKPCGDLAPKKYSKGFEQESLDLLREQNKIQNESVQAVKELADILKKIAESLEVLSNWVK